MSLDSVYPPPPLQVQKQKKLECVRREDDRKKKGLYLSETHCRFYNQLPFCASWPRNKCFKKSIKGGRRADRELLFSRAVGLFAFFRLSLLLPKAAAAPQGAPAPGRAHRTARPSAALCARLSSCSFSSVNPGRTDRPHGKSGSAESCTLRGGFVLLTTH